MEGLTITNMAGGNAAAGIGAGGVRGAAAISAFKQAGENLQALTQLVQPPADSGRGAKVDRAV
ncbi:MAG: hypothetical protein ING19_17330 [Azospirillum sp.]|nr:hypothetical protein [Azospirillum sp.]